MKNTVENGILLVKPAERFISRVHLPDVHLYRLRLSDLCYYRLKRLKNMLQKGDQIPDLTLSDQNGKDVALRSYIGHKSLVVYFYPKNETPVCTAEACLFRNYYEAFGELGAEVIGISGDRVKSHLSVINKRKLPFSLLSDQKRKAEKAFGVPRNLFGLLPGRVTFIIDSKGIVIDVFHSALNVKKHIFESLNILKLHNRKVI